jgi:hypothetical protein
MSHEEYLLSTLLTPLGILIAAGTIFLVAPPMLSLYCSLHNFKYRWTDTVAKRIAGAMHGIVVFQNRIFEMLFRALIFLVMINGLIAIPHLLQLWVTTAKEIDHATFVLLASAAGLLIAYKFPNLSQNLWRIQHLNSKGRSQLSEQELAEADNFAEKFDRFWEMAKTAIFLNGLIFWGYGLSILGLR